MKKILLILCMVVAVMSAAFAQSVSENTTASGIRQRCTGTNPRTAAIEIDRDGNINLNPCAGRNIFKNGSPLGTGGSVSVGLFLPPSVFSIAGSPVTNSGTLSGNFVSQSPNTVFAGPATGGSATPAFRSLQSADIPALDAGKITTGTIGTARLGSGTANNTTYLRGDGSWAAVPTSNGPTGTGTANYLAVWTGTGATLGNQSSFFANGGVASIASNPANSAVTAYFSTSQTPNSFDSSFRIYPGTTNNNGNVFGIYGYNNVGATYDLFRAQSGGGGTAVNFRIKGDGQTIVTSNTADDSGLTLTNLTSATALTTGAGAIGVNSVGKVVRVPTTPISSVVNGGNGFGQYVAVFDAASATGGILRSSPIWVNDPDEIRFFEGGTFGGYKAVFDRANLRTTFSNLTTPARYFDLQLGANKSFDVALPTGLVRLGDINNVGNGNKITVLDSSGNVELTASTDLNLYSPGIALLDKTGGTTASILLGGSVSISKRLFLPTAAGAACAGQATLSAGSVTVATSCVTANSVIQITRKGTASVNNLSVTPAAGSFTINSTSSIDGGTVYFTILN